MSGAGLGRTNLTGALVTENHFQVADTLQGAGLAEGTAFDGKQYLGEHRV